LWWQDQRNKVLEEGKEFAVERGRGVSGAASLQHVHIYNQIKEKN
jgi:hypothetical protein